MSLCTLHCLLALSLPLSLTLSLPHYLSLSLSSICLSLIYFKHLLLSVSTSLSWFHFSSLVLHFLYYNSVLFQPHRNRICSKLDLYLLLKQRDIYFPTKSFSCFKEGCF
uniref:Secreted protein n=1 Tax=Cacopsylla melanoneura TaxID=428564 RepID=A0A8D8Z9A1_9HEMI